MSKYEQISSAWDHRHPHKGCFLVLSGITLGDPWPLLLALAHLGGADKLPEQLWRKSLCHLEAVTNMLG